MRTVLNYWIDKETVKHIQINELVNNTGLI